MPGPPPHAVEVFYSYAHKDEELRNKLAEHLGSLRRQGYITQWHDRLIQPGTDWAQEIDTHLSTASIILLLISPSFLASDYCYGLELQRALERQAHNEARVIPIILRPVDWKGAPFEKLQALPTDAKPLTTWRNRDQAFLEVTRGLRKVIEEWTTSAVSTPLSSELYWHVPYQRNPYFTGQEAILIHLHNQFRVDGSTASTRIQAISGLGGIGKTQLALEYAYRHRNEYQTVLWANADARESLVSEYVALATFLELPEREAQDQGMIVEAVKYWLDTHDRWLLILDNADDVAMARDFLPQARKGHILLTTRASAQGTVAWGIGVDPMEETEAALFLLQRARVLTPNAALDQATAADRTTAGAIVQALDGLPLALDQAGAYIEETGCGLLGYLERYRARRTVLLQRRGNLVTDHPEPVAKTWSLSFQRIEQTSPAASDLLRFCAVLHPDAIPEELITEGASELGLTLQPLAGDLMALDEVMEALRAYSLLRRNPGANTLTIHRLVQAVLRDGMHEDQRRQWIERATGALVHIFPDPGEVAQWPLCQRFILHAQACAALITEWDISSSEAARLLNRAGYYLNERAQYTEAEPLLQRALSIREQVLGANHPDVAHTLNSLAVLYGNQGKYGEAEPLYQRALTIYEQVFGPNHPDVATVLENYAFLLRKTKREGKAAELEIRAKTIRTKTHF
jgi:tetratricopeptide (TPR) repeat protein